MEEEDGLRGATNAEGAVEVNSDVAMEVSGLAGLGVNAVAAVEEVDAAGRAAGLDTAGKAASRECTAAGRVAGPSPLAAAKGAPAGAHGGRDAAAAVVVTTEAAGADQHISGSAPDLDLRTLRDAAAAVAAGGDTLVVEGTEGVVAAHDVGAPAEADGIDGCAHGVGPAQRRMRGRPRKVQAAEGTKRAEGAETELAAEGAKRAEGAETELAAEGEKGAEGTEPAADIIVSSPYDGGLAVALTGVAAGEAVVVAVGRPPPPHVEAASHPPSSRIHAISGPVAPPPPRVDTARFYSRLNISSSGAGASAIGARDQVNVAPPSSQLNISCSGSGAPSLIPGLKDNWGNDADKGGDGVEVEVAGRGSGGAEGGTQSRGKRHAAGAVDEPVAGVTGADKRPPVRKRRRTPAGVVEDEHAATAGDGGRSVNREVSAGATGGAADKRQPVHKWRAEDTAGQQPETAAIVSKKRRPPAGATNVAGQKQKVAGGKKPRGEALAKAERQGRGSDSVKTGSRHGAKNAAGQWNAPAPSHLIGPHPSALALSPPADVTPAHDVVTLSPEHPPQLALGAMAAASDHAATQPVSPPSGPPLRPDHAATQPASPPSGLPLQPGHCQAGAQATPAPISLAAPQRYEALAAGLSPMAGMSPMVALGTAQREAVSATIEAAVRWGAGSGGSALLAAGSGGDGGRDSVAESGGVGVLADIEGVGGGRTLVLRSSSGQAEAEGVAAQAPSLQTEGGKASEAEGAPALTGARPSGSEAEAAGVPPQEEDEGRAESGARAGVGAGAPPLAPPQTAAGEGEEERADAGAGEGEGAGAPPLAAAMVDPRANAVVATTEAAGADLHISGSVPDLDLRARRVRVNALVASTLEKYGGVTSVLPSMHDMLATFACAMARLGAPPGPTLTALRAAGRSLSQVS